MINIQILNITLVTILLAFSIRSRIYGSERDKYTKDKVYKEFYERAYNYYVKKIPMFTKEIQAQNIHLFKKFYVLYIKNKALFAFDLIENKKIVHRNIIYDDFVLRKGKLYFKKLYYNHNNYLAKEEIHKDDAVNSFSYSYDEYGRRTYIEKDDALDKNSITSPYDPKPNERTDILSFGSESFQALKHILPKIKIKYLTVNKNKAVTLKIVNQNNEDIYSIAISADIYNKNGEKVETLLAKPIKDIFRNEDYLKIKTNGTNNDFIRIGVYIHYKLKYYSKWKHIGPFFFMPKKIKIVTKPLVPLKKIKSYKVQIDNLAY